MSDSKGTSGAPTETSGQGTGTETQQQETQAAKDQVSYETHRKLLAEKKALQEKFLLAEKELSERREAELKADGKKDELLESYKKKLNEVESKYKNAVGSFAYNSIQRSVISEAAKLGCDKVDDLVELYKSKLTEVEVDDQFMPNTEHIKSLVEAARKERPYLFSKSATPAKTGIPSSNMSGAVMSGANLHEAAKLALKGMLKN